MRAFSRLMLLCLLGIVCVVTVAARSAAQGFSFTTQDLGGGLFEYDITVNAIGSPEPIQGLLFFNANSGFGVDGSSSIGAPSGWNFIAPLPPFVDQLSYFSLAHATDIPIGGSLGGFTFQSSTDPSTVSLADFQMGYVGGITSTDLPEPSSLTAFGAGALSLLACAWRLRKRVS